jgi:hypothetical protein
VNRGGDGGARGNDLGRAAAAAAQTNERGPTRQPDPEERTTSGGDQHSSPIGPPDAEQLAELTAQAMLNKAGAAMREALRFPNDVANLRTIVAELLLENAMLRLDVQRLGERVDRLEGRVGR